MQWGVRELEGGERVLLTTRGVHTITDLAPLDGMEVFLHVDLDVLDPADMPARFPVAGGASPEKLRDLLTEVAEQMRGHRRGDHVDRARARHAGPPGARPAPAQT